MGDIFFDCSITAETCVANQTQTFGHNNYSSQMCLFVLVESADSHLNSFMGVFFLYPSEVCVFVKIRSKCERAFKNS